MLSLKNYCTKQRGVWRTIVGLLLPLSISPSCFALLIVNEIRGDVEIVAQNQVHSPMLVGSILDPQFSSQLEGNGSIEVICALTGEKLQFDVPGKITHPCNNTASVEQVYRSNETNDAPIILFPVAGRVESLSHIYWGSRTKGKFEIRLQRQLDSGELQNVYTTNHHANSLKQKKFITYHYQLPERILQNLKPGENYKLTITNQVNGYSNEESSTPGGRYQISMGDKSENGLSFDKVSSEEVKALGQSIYLLERNRFYKALIALESINKAPSLTAHRAFLTANIFRKSGLPFGYSASLYQVAVNKASKSDKDVIIAALACHALQEDPFSIDEYWEKQVDRLKKNKNTQKYCKG